MYFINLKLKRKLSVIGSDVCSSDLWT